MVSIVKNILYRGADVIQTVQSFAAYSTEIIAQLDNRSTSIFDKSTYWRRYKTYCFQLFTQDTSADSWHGKRARPLTSITTFTCTCCCCCCWMRCFCCVLHQSTFICRAQLCQSTVLVSTELSLTDFGDYICHARPGRARPDNTTRMPGTVPDYIVPGAGDELRLAIKL